VGVIGDVAGEVASMKGVVAAEASPPLRRHRHGRSDQRLDEPGRLIIQRIQSVAGVSRTLTCPCIHEMVSTTPLGAGRPGDREEESRRLVRLTEGVDVRMPERGDRLLSHRSGGRVRVRLPNELTDGECPQAKVELLGQGNLSGTWPRRGRTSRSRWCG
jgi:hypothetical protein